MQEKKQFLKCAVCTLWLTHRAHSTTGLNKQTLLYRLLRKSSMLLHAAEHMNTDRRALVRYLEKRGEWVYDCIQPPSSSD